MKDVQRVYIQSKGKVVLEGKRNILLKDIIHVVASEEYKEAIEKLHFNLEGGQRGEAQLVSMLSIINLIGYTFSNMMIEVVGSPDILIYFTKNKNEKTDRFKILRVAVVCFLLFVGSITAIINFHSDVDMQEAHKTIYRVITGKENERPLLLQIPYSIGIGIGMSVFFNHVFKKRINNEPSPLEVEMYLYQQNMDEYIKNNNDKV